MRGRTAFPVLLGLGLVAAVVMDQVRPSLSHHGRVIRTSALGGTFACPVGYVGDGVASVTLANIDTVPAHARVTIVSDNGDPAVVQTDLAPGAVQSVPLQGRPKLGGAGVIVDYAGGEMVASHSFSLTGSRNGGGGSSAMCASPGPAVLVVPRGSTLRTDTTLALMNPGSGEAVVDVTFAADGKSLAPEGLRGRIVPARRRLLVRLSDFVFDARDVTSIVSARTGRVVAESLVATGRSVALMTAAEPSNHSVVIAGEGGPGTLSVLPVGDDASSLDARVIDPAQQTDAQGISPEIGPPGPALVGLAAGRPLAYSIAVEAGSPIAAGARWRVDREGSSDEAGTVGAAPERRWGVAADVGEPSSTASLLVANDDEQVANVRIRPLGAAHIDGVTPTQIPSGRLLVLPIGRGPGSYAASVESDRAVVVALTAFGRGVRGLAAYALTGWPVVEPPETTVESDARVGIPAPLPKGELPFAALLIPVPAPAASRRRSRSGGRSRGARWRAPRVRDPLGSARDARSGGGRS